MEKPITFQTAQNRLYGILHQETESDNPEVVVLMVVGGPETRYGSHRLYIQLARFLFENGMTVLRFDYEGMGDSEGDFAGFQKAAPSIDAAIDFLARRFPNAKKVIWALCDGSSASVIYANKKPDKISGLILCNPFIFTTEGRAKTELKHYYSRRLLEKEFWKKLLFFQIDFKKTFSTLIKTIRKANLLGSQKSEFLNNLDKISLPSVIVEGIIEFGRPVRCILSTDDLRAREFLDAFLARKGIEKFIEKGVVNYQIVKGADHTFTDPDQKKILFENTVRYIDEIVKFNQNANN